MVEIAYSSLISIADNKHSFHYDSGIKEDAHVVNSMDDYNKIVENRYTTRYIQKKVGEYDKLITFINRKASKVSPSKFEDWVQSQGGEQNFTSLVNLTTSTRRRRSFLSNVYYSSDQNTPSITLTAEGNSRI